MSLFMRLPNSQKSRKGTQNLRESAPEIRQTWNFDAKPSHKNILHRSHASLPQTLPSWRALNFARKRHTGDPAMLIVLFVATFALLSLAFVPALTLDD